MTFIPTGPISEATLASGTPERFAIAGPNGIKQAIRIYFEGGIPSGNNVFLRFGDSAVNASIGSSVILLGNGEIFGVPRGATHVSLLLNGGLSVFVSVAHGEFA